MLSIKTLVILKTTINILLKCYKGGVFMRKMCNKDVILKYSICFGIVVSVLVLLAIGRKCCVTMSFLLNMERETDMEVFTSTKYRYEKKFRNTLERYSYFASLYNPKASTAVPGLEITDVLGTGCDQMVPQGICVTDDYMLITAYDSAKNDHKRDGKSRHKPSNSVLYVLSNQNPAQRELLTTIVLPDVNHVGGVAFDGKNIWIAKSTTRQCSRISYEVIKEAVNSGLASYQLSSYCQNVPCGAVASFLAYYDGLLWVGTYRNGINDMGSLRGYNITHKNTAEGMTYELQKQEEIVIPGYANGVEFAEIGGKSYMAVVTSRGRYFNSEIYFYNILTDPNTGKNLYYCYNSSKFPPMAEELAIDGENMYFLFESSATCYSTPTYLKCSYPVDRVCALSMLDLFFNNQGAGYQKASATQKMILQIVQDEMYVERKYWQRYGIDFSEKVWLT